MKKTRTEKGITLIALIITIVVLLILAVASIRAVQGDGIIGHALAARKTYSAAQVSEEVQLILNHLETDVSKDDNIDEVVFLQEKLGKDAKIETSGKGNFVIKYKGYILNVEKYAIKTIEKTDEAGNDTEESFNPEEWDNGGAALQDVFIWKSDDPTSPDYGTIIGYTANVDTYTILRYPSRCTKITFEYNEERYRTAFGENNLSDTEGIRRSRAFTNNIQKVEIPETVTEIGAYAFGQNTLSFNGLNEIIIPESVTSIGNYAFEGCRGLTRMTIPSNVTSMGTQVFNSCDSLLVIYCEATAKPEGWNTDWNNGCNANIIWSADGTEKWDDGAASQDTFIWKSDDPTSEDYGTIIGYTAKAENYTILRYPTRCTKIILQYDSSRYNGVTLGQSRSFTNNILKIEIPGTVKVIERINWSDGNNDDDIFTRVSEVLLKEGVTTIGDYAFDYYINLTDITIPSSVTSIGDYAFYACRSLESIIIPNSVTSIGNYAFDGCHNLVNITIPEGIQSIGSGAFSSTGALYNSKNSGEDVFYIGKCLIGPINESMSGNYTIEAGTKIVANNAFGWSNNKLTSIIIPESVDIIGNEAFKACQKLAKIKLKTTTIVSIGSNAFDDLVSGSIIYVLNKDVEKALEGKYDSTKTTVEVVTAEQMENL